MICFAVIMFLAAVATVSALLWYSARIDDDYEDDSEEGGV